NKEYKNALNNYSFYRDNYNDRAYNYNRSRRRGLDDCCCDGSCYCCCNECCCPGGDCGDLCCKLWCADSCCECMGGDLISCI
ncbi:MAG: hypothetical protein LBR30_02720, partial [Clostridioides sp.]|nr:hypothetical protein [Clostridioides sp.]